MKILGLLRRNVSGSSQYVKTQAYNSLVRPHVEYASAAWSPFEKQDIKALEAVQCCAIRFVCSDYSQFSSVTSMQHSLDWDILEVRRHVNAATIMYEAVHNLTHLTFPASVTLAHRSNRSNHPHKFRHTFAHTNAYKLSPFGMAFPILLLMLSLLLTSKRMLFHPYDNIAMQCKYVFVVNKLIYFFASFSISPLTVLASCTVSHMTSRINRNVCMYVCISARTTTAI